MTPLFLRACSALALIALPCAVAAAPALAKSETLQCGDRKIVLEASCFDLYGPRMLACSSQRLTISDSATGKVLSVRDFKPMKRKGEPDVVPEQFGEIACVTTRSNTRYIVADMASGGNCEQCEWNEVYDWNGTLLGSNRDRKTRLPALQEALEGAVGKNGARVTGKTELPGFYSAMPMK